MHISALLQAGVEVVALCDPDARKAGQMAARVPGARMYTDADLLLEEQRPDAVHVLTPPASHAALAVRAAEAGSHVLVEKPMALSLADADRMVEAARRHGVMLAPIHNYLSKPSIRRARNLVASGRVGEVVHVESFYGLSDEAGSYAGAGGAHWAHLLPGGVFTNFLPHLIYLQQQFMGDIESVAGVVTGRGPDPAEPATELSALVHGATVTGTMTVSTRTAPYAKFVRVYGTRGIVHADLVGEVTTFQRSRRVPRLLSKALLNLELVSQLVAGTAANSAKVATGTMRNMPDLHAFMAELYRSLEDGSPPPAGGADGREVVRILEQIWERLPAEPEPDPPSPERSGSAPQTAAERRSVEAGASRAGFS